MVTSMDGVLNACPLAISPLNASFRLEEPTEFHAAAACFTWLNTEPKLSLGANAAGLWSLTKNVTVLFVNELRSNFS